MARLSVALLLLGLCAAALAFSLEDEMLTQELSADEADLNDMALLDLPEELTPAVEARGLLGCKSGHCRKKCNKKGKNGACAGPLCVCWS